MGFRLEEGDSKIDGTPVYANYDGPDQARVLFTRMIYSYVLYSGCTDENICTSPERFGRLRFLGCKICSIQRNIL